MAEVFTPVTFYSLLATAIMAVAAYIMAKCIGYKNSRSDQWVLFWLIWDAMIHFFLEGSFVLLSLIGTVNDSSHWTALLWKEYALADKRWGVSDPTIVSLEMLTVGLVGPLCVWLIYAIRRNKPYRHWIQLVLCTCELYGGWMTFVPDVLVGSPNLVTDHWLYLWVYLVFFNGIWVVVPLLLMYQSWEAMSLAFSKNQSGKTTSPANKSTKMTENRRFYNTRGKKLS